MFLLHCHGSDLPRLLKQEKKVKEREGALTHENTIQPNAALVL